MIRSVVHTLRHLVAGLAVTLLGGWVLAAPTAVGTTLTNTAAGAYVDSVSGLHFRLTSNTVTTSVQPFEALALAGTQSVSRTPGGSFELSHQLTNTGNTSSSYKFRLVVSSAGFVPTNLLVIQDVNGNGAADPGEPAVSTDDVLPLASGATARLLITGLVPASAVVGQSTQIQITATSQAQNVSSTNTDTVTIVSGAAVSVTQSASTTQPIAGGDLSLTFRAVNNGNGPASPLPVVVNGVASQWFVMRTTIPANTTFLGSESGSSGGQLLYHRLGDPVSSYVTVQPTDTVVDAVAWVLPSLTGTDAPIASGMLSGTLRVRVNSNASGVVSSVGFADYRSLGANFTESSNLLRLPLADLPPSITFYASSAYATPMRQSPIGAPLFVQVNAAQCNTDPGVIDTRPVTLISQLTGDAETFVATETAVNSGIFRILPRVPTANAAAQVVAAGNGVLEVLRNDGVTATLAGCGSSTVTTTLLIDPSGVVFDSKTNAVVAGATVRLIDVTGAGNGGNAGGAALVFEADGASLAPTSVVTGADGSYHFPFVPPSQYRLMVVPPNGYAFPSKLPPSVLPPTRAVNATGSYGEPFPVTVAGGAVVIDIPVDVGAAGGLFIQKAASKAVAELGDFVNYTVTLNNNTGTLLKGSVIHDRLPAGFAYVRGSARLNGAALADPVGGLGPSLDFGVGAVAPGIQSALSYRVRIGAGSDAGDGVNSAQMSSDLTLSNVATVKVQVTGGVFSDKAYLAGKVYADCNANRLQDANEPGISGVRLYLDNGTFAVTDSEGKYSLYGLTPRTHVIKVDSASLPDGAVLQILDNRQAGDAASRFVDLRNSELQRADFAVVGCNPALRDQIDARRSAMTGQPREIDFAAKAVVSLQPTFIGDARSLPASGLVGKQAALAGQEPAIQPRASTAQRVDLIEAGTTVPPAFAPSDSSGMRPVSLEVLLPKLSPQPGFIDLNDGQVMPTDQSRVRVKGPLGTQLRLSVNGQPLGEEQVGEKSSLESVGVVAWDYVGVNLKPGKNTLVLSSVDGFGNTRGEVALHVVAPGKLARIIITPPAQVTADGVTPVSVNVQLVDAQGVAVTSRTALTLESTLGEWQIVDLDPNEPGTQIFVEGGSANLVLLPPADPGKATLRMSSGEVRTRAELVYVPNLRPLIAAGLVEGVISLRNLDPNALVPTRSGDVFEREIQSASRSFDNGKGSAAARASLFLKGKVLGSTLLTLAYDSDKPKDTALFRDIQPDQFYPVYGDSSLKGYDAQSTGKLYVRLDQGTSYALYGDYLTQGDNPARLLSQYSRALNGVKGRLEEDGLVADAFASYTNSTQVIDEIAANGTSGPYRISRLNGVINSQRVDLVTRDRNQPSLVLASVPLAQFTDYAIEPATGQILFKAPVASLDADLNPVYIRVTYEVNAGGPKFWVTGVDVRQTVTDGLTLGGTYVRDANVLNPQSLRGGNFFWAISPQTSLVGELAQSTSEVLGSGGARRLELRHTDPRLQLRAYAVQTDPSFSNASSTFTAGASEYGAKLGYSLDDKTRLIAEALKTTASGNLSQTPGSIALATGPLGSLAANAGVVSGATREAELIGIERSLPMDLKLTLSLRRVDGNGQPTQPLATGAVPNGYTSVRARLDAPVPGVPQATAFIQYEQAINDDNRSAATFGGTYQVAPQTKLYATHQTSNSLTGDYGLNPSQQNYSTVAGVDTTYMQDGQLFSEYRVGDSIDGRSARAATGLRNLWKVAPGLGLSTSVQQIHPVTGVVSDKATALTGALEYTANPDWKGSTRLEWSKSATTQTWLATLGAAAKVDEDLTALARVAYNTQTNSSAAAGSIRLRQVQLGLAYRPVDNNVWNALARVEFKRNQNSTLGTALNVDESANIFSTHFNYQLSPGLVFNGRYGVKWAADYSQGFTSTYTSQLLGGRATWDINGEWDAGVQYFVDLGGKGQSRLQQAVGVEVGYLVKKNFWVSGGYNFKGFRDPDLTGDDVTQRGVYLRMRFKFDEALFKSEESARPAAATAQALP